MNVLRYEQGSGRLLYGDPRGRLQVLARGYSGRGKWVNDPNGQAKPGEGPIPRGLWIVGKPRHHPTLGPVAIPLTAAEETDAFGRSGFYIHGDNRANNRTASRGCIIVNGWARDEIVKSGVSRLEVVL